MHRAAHDLAVFGEDDLDVRLGDHGRVEVADEDAGVEGARVILVGHVAGLGLPSHPRPAAGGTQAGSDGEGSNKRRGKRWAQHVLGVTQGVNYTFLKTPLEIPVGT